MTDKDGELEIEILLAMQNLVGLNMFCIWKIVLILGFLQLKILILVRCNFLENLCFNFNWVLGR